MVGRYPTVLRAIVGIPVFNEAQNIGNLLEAIIRTTSGDPRVEKILVVSSSTDTTDTVVKGFSDVDKRVALVKEEERRGKASAWNMLIQYAEDKGFDSLVYMGGDNIPFQNGISRLLDGLENGFGIVGGRPIPIDSPKTFIGWCTNLQWNIHHQVCKYVKPKVTGELCAFRTKVVREMPPGLINDDTYLERLFEIRGFNVGYCENAMVLLKGPATLTDLIRQRRRIYIGHHQIRAYVGQKPSTIWYRSFLLIRKALPSRGLRPFIYLVLDIFLQGAVYLIAKLDFYRGSLPYKWSMAETTKSLQYGI